MQKEKSTSFTVMNRMFVPKATFHTDGSFREKMYSFKINKKTVVVLDNASVHRNAKIPSYFPPLNIVETLWRIMKGKWLRPQDYNSADTLFYATNRALVEIGKGLRINYAHTAA